MHRGDPRGTRPSRQRGWRTLTRSGPTLPSSSPHLHASRSTLAAQLPPAASATAADARAAAAAALAGRGHVTRPAGSLRAGGRARAHERRLARLGATGTGRFTVRAFKGRIRRARPRAGGARARRPELGSARGRKGGRSAGRATRASAAPLPRSLFLSPVRAGAGGCPRPLLRSSSLLRRPLIGRRPLTSVFP